ncbi:sulfatase-like hydrolase/transferase [Polaribacter haliotis]|uniref:Sulfatase-like hydrolase/transferase n=1 Tax=Polaribacter haliotis TaxID=1888915 RepID=A0A7L8AGI5_9FLAO|nr:phosphoethanolamine transferase [Polaribacter haliotis]QOD61121.1 sulfatase-like hydrolase/transferase [Polaribacter haliotis]
MDRKIRNKRQYFYIASLIIFLMIPNLLLIIIGEDSAVGSLFKKIVFFLISFSIVLLPLSFLKPKFYTYIILLLFPVVVFESYHILHFKTISSQEIIANIFQTNFNETKELIISNVNYFVLSLIILFLILWISTRVKNSFYVSKKFKKTILLLFLFTFTILGIRNFRLAYNNHESKSDIITTINYSFKVQMTKNFPVGFFIKCINVLKGFELLNKYDLETKNFKFNAVKKDTLNESEIYVLVIGETARKHNFHIYGYSKNTSPNLDSIKNLLIYKNVKSNSNVTSLSVPFMLTRATPEEPNRKYNELSVLKAFREAGFSTYWISNQQIGIGSVFNLYSKNADTYINTSKSLDASGFDENILPIFNNVINNFKQKKFIIIHTIGSHFRYNYRYPEKYKKFTPTLKKGLSIENTTDSKKKKEIINSYDNSILYTDFLLGEIIQKLKKKNAVSYMYYISDHGENLFDTEDNKILHGFETPSKFEIEIPLFIWTSKKYNNLYSEKTENLNKNINHKISSINTFQTILDMSNISYPNFKKQKSFANKKFDTLQKRTFYTVNKTVLKLD